MEGLELVKGLPDVTPIVGEYSLVGRSNDIVAAQVHDVTEQQYPASTHGTTASSVPEQQGPGVPVTEQPTNPLARTGLEADTLGVIALGLFAGGAVLVAASKRPTRRF